MNHPVAEPTVTKAEASLDRAQTANPNFIPQFYETFMGKRDAFSKMFTNVDMVHQYARLYNGLIKLFEYARNPAPETLSLLAKIHSRKHVGVKPAYYFDWLDALLGTLKSCDPKFDSSVAEHWIATLMPGIEYLKAQY